jgi:hypothetical protein
MTINGSTQGPKGVINETIVITNAAHSEAQIVLTKKQSIKTLTLFLEAH